jgi:hypothetical protein
MTEVEVVDEYEPDGSYLRRGAQSTAEIAVN